MNTFTSLYDRYQRPPEEHRTQAGVLRTDAGPLTRALLRAARPADEGARRSVVALRNARRPTNGNTTCSTGPTRRRSSTLWHSPAAAGRSNSSIVS
jgi:hypothetical protein